MIDMASYVIAIIPQFNGAYYQTIYLDFETRGQNITRDIYEDPVRLRQHLQKEFRVLLKFWEGEIPCPQTQSIENPSGAGASQSDFENPSGAGASELVTRHRRSEPMTECTYILIKPEPELEPEPEFEFES